MYTIIKRLIAIALVLVLAGCTPIQGNLPKNTASPQPTTPPSTQTNYVLDKIDIKNDYLAAQAKIDETLQAELKRGYKFSDPFVTLNPYLISPLTALVMFNTDTATTVQLTVFGHDSKVDIKTTFPAATQHILPIYGLYPGEKNNVELVLQDGTKKTISIETEALNAISAKAKVLTKVDGQFAEGLTFCDPSSITPENISSMAYDSNGDIRWYLMEEGTTMPTRLLANGRIMSSTVNYIDGKYYSCGLREMDLIGKVYFEYVFPGGQHHDFIEMPNGNIIACSSPASFKTVEDRAVEIDRKTGKIVKTFDMNDYFSQTDGGSFNKKGNDWFHLNALSYNPKTDTLIFSGRNVDGIVGVDYTTKKLKWFMGDPEGWTKLNKKYFFKPELLKQNSFALSGFQWSYAQHACNFTPEGDIVLFDNGSYRAKRTNPEDVVKTSQSYSRGVHYKIDTKKMVVEQVWSFGKERGNDWYSSFISATEYLGPNHYLMTSGALLETSKIDAKSTTPGVERTASIVETRGSKVVFELLVNVLVYRSERRKMYTDKNTFDLNLKGVFVGTYGTFPSEKGVSYDLKSKVQPNFRVEMFKEYGRIVIKGNWNTTTAPKDASIIIKNEVTNETFVTPLTAIPGGNPNQKYYAMISAEGLSGKYSVYITAAGKTYLTKYKIVY